MSSILTHRVWAGLLALFCALGSNPAAAQHYIGPLYDGPAPGSAHWTQELVVDLEDGGESRFNTSEPRIQVFLPEPAEANGAAVVMLPGGGLRVLGMGQDMRDTINRFTTEGVAVILLEYRTLQLSPEEIARATAPRPANLPPMKFPEREIRNANANPSPDDPALNEVLRLATMDAQHTLRLVRSRAAEWNVDPARVGMFGTSAGGGVALSAMLAGENGETPDFIISNFGPALQDVNVPENAPPLFLITESEHGPVTDGLISLFNLWNEQKKPAELHVYDVPNFSMSVSLWGNRLFDWMREQEFVPSDGSRVEATLP